jgi:hypothetical protein
MREITAGRTLVKSPPELWAVCSDADLLAKHLESFGEIRITRLEPETTVAWEGERASGTVRIEPAGWGTKVTVTAAEEEPTATPDPAAAETAAAETGAAETGAAEPEGQAPTQSRRAGFFARLFSAGRGAASASEPVVPIEPEPTRPQQPPVDTAAALEAALDSLGQAHRRPFSR